MFQLLCILSVNVRQNDALSARAGVPSPVPALTSKIIQYDHVESAERAAKYLEDWAVSQNKYTMSLVKLYDPNDRGDELLP